MAKKYVLMSSKDVDYPGVAGRWWRSISCNASRPSPLKLKKRSAELSKQSISRRTFNSAAALASLAAVAPFVPARRARARETTDVVVIGSGLSGLNAAWILSEAGIDVLVLEGSRSNWRPCVDRRGKMGNELRRGSDRVGGISSGPLVCPRPIRHRTLESLNLERGPSLIAVRLSHWRHAH